MYANVVLMKGQIILGVNRLWENIAQCILVVLNEKVREHD